MLNLKVEYCKCQNDLNKFLEQFNLQRKDVFPVLQRVTYLAGPISGEIYAIVEYVDGEPEEVPASEEPQPAVVEVPEKSS